MHESTYRILAFLPLALAACAAGPRAALPPAPGAACESRLLHHAVVARIQPDTGDVDATSELRFSCPPAAFLRLFLHDGLAIAEASSGATRLVALRHDEVKPDFAPRGVAWDVSGSFSSNVVRLSYRGVISHTDTHINGITAELVELAIYSAWVPVLPGLPLFTSELEVDLPASLDVVSRGQRLARTVQGDRAVERWKSDIPSFDVCLLAATGLKRLRRELSTTLALEVVARHTPDDMLGRVLDDGAAALHLFSDAFGPLGTNSIARVVLSPRGGWGYSRTGLVIVSEEYALSRTSGEGVRDDAHGNAHELGHFWFGLTHAVGDDDWMNEALAEYSALRFSGARFGDAEADRWRAHYRTKIVEKRPDVALAHTPRGSPFRHINWYQRGALFFDALERSVGRARFDAWLRARRGAFPVSTKDLEGSIARELGPDATVLAQRWLHDVALPADAAEGAVGAPIN